MLLYLVSFLSSKSIINSSCVFARQSVSQLLSHGKEIILPCSQSVLNIKLSPLH